MSLEGFIKEEMIEIKEDPAEREDYYKGLIENFYNVICDDVYDTDRQIEILDKYYDKHSPFHIKIDGEKFKNKFTGSMFLVGVHDYMYEGDSCKRGRKAVENILDEWTNDFVCELEEDGIITEEEIEKWGNYYYNFNEEDD